MALGDRNGKRTRKKGRLGAAVIAASMSLANTGCQGISHSIAQWRSSYDTSGIARPISADEKAQTGNFLTRWFSPGKPGDGPSLTARDPSGLVMGSDGWKPLDKPKADPKAEAEIKAAHELYMKDELAQAEKEFARIAKNRKGSPYGSKAQFFLAETQFQQKKYVNAHDSYEKLIADYPGTDRLEQAVKREYEIAQIWLAQSDPKAKKDEAFTWTSHFDGKQPLIDTQGSALKALEHVRVHDPTGPLADDALMKIADYHMQNADYESAGIYYDQLIQDHPKSPMARQAALLAIDARMKGYRGPEFDASGLERSRELVKQTMQRYPEQPAGNNQLYKTLDLINDAEAEKTFTTGAYYKKIGRIQAAELYFGKIPQRWPESPWAKKAKTELASLAKMPRTQSLPSRILTQPLATDPNYSAGSGMGGMGGGGMGMGAPGGMM